MEFVIVLRMAHAASDSCAAATSGAAHMPAVCQQAHAAVPLTASLAANTGRRVLKAARAALFAIVALLSAVAAAMAQQMPADDIGVWAADGAACDLTRAVPDGAPEGEFPFLIVTREGYSSHEATCRLAPSAPPEAQRHASRRLTFTCEGEGMTWTTHERWETKPTARQAGGWTLQQSRLLKDGRSFTKCTIDAAPDPQGSEGGEGR